MVKVFGKPVQIRPALVNIGVTVMVATIGRFPVFIAINEGIESTPLDDKPIAVLLFVHEYVVPTVVGAKFIVAIASPLQTTGETGCVNCADGLIVIVNVLGVPVVQVTPALVYVGVTAIIAFIGIVPEFTAVKLGIVPVPFAANPIDGVSFVHV